MVHVVVNVEYWPFDQAMPVQSDLLSIEMCFALQQNLTCKCRFRCSPSAAVPAYAIR